MTSLIGFDSQDKRRSSDEKKPPEKSGALFAIYEWFELFVIAFAIVIIIMTCIARHSPVEGESMMDTLHENDILIISDLFYTPKQGDIVVFQNGYQTSFEKPYVKRIIAVGGQTVTVDDDTGKVYVDGEELDEESYAMFIDYMASDSTVMYPCKVPEGYVFVMGDNRNHSNDSRYIGVVDERCILGRAVLRVFPLDRFGTVG